jgi:hypothetical protein
MAAEGPWKMYPADVPETLRREAPVCTVERMVKYAHFSTIRYHL